MPKKNHNFNVIVVDAIRRLQAPEGSSVAKIARCIKDDYEIKGPTVRRKIDQTIKKGMIYGILEKSKRGYTTCEQNLPKVMIIEQVTECSKCKKLHKKKSERRPGKRMQRGHANRRSRSRVKRMQLRKRRLHSRRLSRISAKSRTSDNRDSLLNKPMTRSEDDKRKEP